MEYGDCDEYYEGMQAFYKGSRLDNNPYYKYGSIEEALAWKDGWLDAQWGWGEDDDDEDD